MSTSQYRFYLNQSTGMIYVDGLEEINAPTFDECKKKLSAYLKEEKAKHGAERINILYTPYKANAFKTGVAGMVHPSHWKEERWVNLTEGGRKTMLIENLILDTPENRKALTALLKEREKLNDRLEDIELEIRSLPTVPETKKSGG